jgi:hypothetical protein
MQLPDLIQYGCRLPKLDLRQSNLAHEGMKMRDHRHEDFPQAGFFSAIHHSEDGWRQIAFSFDHHMATSRFLRLPE